MWAWLGVLGLTIWCVTVLWLNRMAWKVWHDPAAFDFVAAAGERRYPRRVARGFARGVAVLAAFWDVLLLVGAAQLLPTGLTLDQVRSWFGALVLALLLACALTLISITVANRPTWLVVPHQRHLTRTDLRRDASAARRRREEPATPRTASKGRRRRHIGGRARPGRRGGSHSGDR